MGIDIATVLTVAGLFVANIAVIVSLFLWMRSESNSDRRQIQDVQRDDRKDLLQVSKNMESTITAIQAEIRDFHHQLIQLGVKK